VAQGIQHPDYQRLAQMPDAVLWKMALTGEIIGISPSIEQVRGITQAEAITQSIDQIHPPESMKISLAYFEQFSRDALAGKVPEPFLGELEYLHADGSLVRCEVIVIPETNEDGDLIGILGVSAPVHH